MSYEVTRLNPVIDDRGRPMMKRNELGDYITHASHILSVKSFKAELKAAKGRKK